jgi:prepilin-type processing-associated H-X9-DG protein
VIESLEARECFSASPLPVLMVLPNMDYGGFAGGVRVAAGDVNGDGAAVLSVDVWEHAAVGNNSGRIGGIAVDPSDPSASSAHPGGVNVVFGDGSVKFSTTSINSIKSPRDTASGQIIAILIGL